MTIREPLWIQMVPGIRRVTTAVGNQLMQMKVELDRGSKLPEHRHPHEQVSFLMSGHLRLWVGGVQHDMFAGDTVMIPSNVLHSAETIEDCVAIDTFAPPREDLLAEDVDHLRRNS